jgi:hypothetical protein
MPYLGFSLLEINDEYNPLKDKPAPIKIPQIPKLG